jgi:hypothetical protein
MQRFLFPWLSSACSSKVWHMSHRLARWSRLESPLSYLHVNHTLLSFLASIIIVTKCTKSVEQRYKGWDYILNLSVLALWCSRLLLDLCLRRLGIRRVECWRFSNISANVVIPISIVNDFLEVLTDLTHLTMGEDEVMIRWNLGVGCCPVGSDHEISEKRCRNILWSSGGLEKRCWKNVSVTIFLMKRGHGKKRRKMFQCSHV